MPKSRLQKTCDQNNGIYRHIIETIYPSGNKSPDGDSAICCYPDSNKLQHNSRGFPSSDYYCTEINAPGYFFSTQYHDDETDSLVRDTYTIPGACCTANSQLVGATSDLAQEF
jgi:hypothetical protein